MFNPYQFFQNQTLGPGDPPKSHYKRLYGAAKDYGVGQSFNFEGGDRYIDKETGYAYFDPMNPESQQEQQVPSNIWNTQRFLFNPMVLGENQYVHNKIYDQQGNTLRTQELYDQTAKSAPQRMRRGLKLANEDLNKYYIDDLGYTKKDARPFIKDKMQEVKSIKKIYNVLNSNKPFEKRNKIGELTYGISAMEGDPQSYFDTSSKKDFYGPGEYHPKKDFISDKKYIKRMPMPKAKKAYRQFLQTMRGLSKEEARNYTNYQHRLSDERVNKNIKSGAKHFNVSEADFKKNPRKYIDNMRYGGLAGGPGDPPKKKPKYSFSTLFKKKQEKGFGSFSPSEKQFYKENYKTTIPNQFTLDSENTLQGTLPVVNVTAPYYKGPGEDVTRKSVTDAIISGGKALGENVLEGTGIRSVERVIKNPVKTAKGVKDAFGAAVSLPDGITRGIYNYMNTGDFDMGLTKFGKPYSQGLSEAGDVLTIAPGIGMSAKAVKPVAKALTKGPSKKAISESVSFGVKRGRPSKNFGKYSPSKKEVDATVKKLAAGADDFDDFIKERIGDLKSKEGYKRLVNQELEYLKTAEGKKRYWDSGLYGMQDDISKSEQLILAKKAADARIKSLEATQYSKELDHYGLWQPTHNRVAKESLNPQNPKFDINQIKGDVYDDFKDLRNNAFYRGGGALLSRTKSVRGQLGVGSRLINNNPAKAHEIAHLFQVTEPLPIDDFLKKNITPKKEISNPMDWAIHNPNWDYNPRLQKDYHYFKDGSGYGSSLLPSKEPSAFAHELREVLLDKGFINHRYDKITPELLKKAHKSPLMKDVKVKLDKGYTTGNYISNTRIFDFMEETDSNYKNLSKALNKLPVVTGVAGTGALLNQTQAPQYRYGGKVKKKDCNCKNK